MAATRKRRKPKTKNPEAVEVGKRIRARREHLTLSREELAARIKTRDGKPQYATKVAQWEQGWSMPTPDRRPELADALETNMGALFGDVIEEETLLKRIDLVEQKVTAIIAIEGLGPEVERRIRKARQKERDRLRKAKSNQSDAARAAAEPLKTRRQPKQRRRSGS